jgi:hypothetical protein
VKERGANTAKLIFLLAVSLIFVLQFYGFGTSEISWINSQSQFVWKQSLPIRSGDPAIGPIGGTEVRSLVAFDNKLFAAIGYWMDTESENVVLPGAQVLRLDAPGSEWQVDLELSERTQLGRRKYLAISNLKEVRLTTDSVGRPLADPARLLLAAVWKRGPGLDVFSRLSGSGASPWSKMTISGQELAPVGTQIRTFAVHKDPVTGQDILFAGATHAIFVGRYDRDQRNIAWQSQPEWKRDSTADPSANARVASFANCNGKLFATASNSIYERLDGNSPTWQKVFETTIHVSNSRITGLRGLTCIREPSRPADVLLVSVEDNPARIYRIDPGEIEPTGEYHATLELDVSSFLSQGIGTRTTYAIVAYNDMMEYADPARACSRLLMGLEAITPEAPQWFGKQHFSPHAYYLVRDCDGNYTVGEIRDFQIEPETQLVSVRTLLVSPFRSDPTGTVYAAGFDANYNPVHNTAWIYKGIPK